MSLGQTYRAEFVEAFELLGAAFEEVVNAGYPRPVLVGGAAVEFYTGGAVVSGDFDVVTPVHEQLEKALLHRGFQRPSGLGVLVRGLTHPRLQIGVEFVSGQLFDGVSDKARIQLVLTESGGIAVPPVEDMIADRMGQYCSNPQGHCEMLEQAIKLYKITVSRLESSLDREYLDRRIIYETAGVYDLQFLAGRADGPDDS